LLTILELLTKTTDYFSKTGIESPRLNAELLLCDVLRCRRLDLYLKFEEVPDTQQIDKFRDYVKRRAKSEPLQYITGYCDFYGIRIEVNPTVLIPRPETELLVERVLQDHSTPIRILDLCTGAGIIPIALAKNLEGCKITAVDISDKALETARKNSIKNEVEDAIDFVKADIKIIPLPIESNFDVITANPPYISISDYENLETGILNFEPKKALTDNADGLTFYKHILNIAEIYLRSNGKIYMEFGTKQSDRLMNLLTEFGYQNIEIINDYGKNPRIITGEKK